MTRPLSRRRMIQLSLTAPALAGPACDGGVIIVIIGLLIEIISIAVAAADEADNPNTEIPLKLLDVAGGVVELENRSDAAQVVEILVELLDRSGNTRNLDVVTENGELPYIPSDTRAQLRLPNMESSIDGEHMLRVSVGGQVLVSEAFTLN